MKKSMDHFGLGKFPYFTMQVSKMTAWQLYVGQTIMVISIGIVVWLLQKMLKALHLNFPVVTESLELAEQVATGDRVHPDLVPNYLKSMF